MIAQGALNQIVASVFNRVRPDPKLASSMLNSVPSPRPSMSRSNSRQGVQADENTSEQPNPSGSATNGNGHEVHTELPDGTQAQAQKEKDTDAPLSDGSRPSTDTVRPTEGAEDHNAQGAELQDAQATADAVVESATPTIKVDGTENGESEAQTEEQQLRPTLAHLPSVSAEVGDGLRTPVPEAAQPFFSLNELHTKDAYLVFRALCKLGMKPLGVERLVPIPSNV